MAMTQEQTIKWQRKVLKHRNRITFYHFQLPAYMRMLKTFNGIKPCPPLNSYLVAHLEALMDLLQRVADFGGYQPPQYDEYDLRELDVGFTFGCNYCDKRGFNARQVLDHVMIGDHRELPKYGQRKFDKFKKRAGDSYDAFLFRKHEVMTKNSLPAKVVDQMIDFSLLTKNFLKMTSRYLSSLGILEQSPSIITACGVLDLLELTDSLITRAKCIESVPEFHTITQQLVTGDLKYVSKGKMFDHVQGAIEHAAFTAGLKQPHGPPVERNIFSLPQMVNKQPLLPLPQNFSCPPPPGMNIPAFMNGPAIRMMPPHPHPVFMRHPPPIMNASMMHVGRNMQEVNLTAQQQIQQQHLLFNPSLIRLGQNLNNLPQQHAVHQQQSVQNPPPMSPQKTEFDLSGCAPSWLPPLNQSGTADCPVLNADVLHFLKQPQLDSLIENGNALTHFDKASVIPSEIVAVLKKVAPLVRVECFGAKVSGVGYEEDNINLYVNDGRQPKKPECVKEMLDTLKSFFIDNKWDWTIQNIQDAGTRTHLTVKNMCENVCCRITFASEIYCFSSKLIRYYAETYPMYQKLCYFIQEFIKLSGLDLNRHIIIILVLFYMQKRDFLPTVAQLQSKVPEAKLSGHWLINFVPRKPEEFKLEPLETDLYKSATDFFKFYGVQFSFQESVVCPQIGLALNRSDFLTENMWRMPLKSYRAYIEQSQAGDSAVRDNFPQFEVTPMCVQDPLELTFNIASQVSSAETGKFAQMCKMAYEFYQNNQQDCS